MKKMRNERENKVTGFTSNSLILLIILLIPLICIFFILGISSITIKASFLLIEYAFFVAIWVTQTKKYVSPFLMFFLYLFLCNAGQLLIFVLDINVTNQISVMTLASDCVISKSINFQILSVYALGFGALLYVFKSKYTAKKSVLLDSCVRNNYAKPKVSIRVGSTRIYILEAAFIILAGFIIFTQFSGLSQRITMGYYDYYTTGLRSSASIMLNFAFYLSYYGLLWRYNWGRKEKKALVLIFGLIVAVLTVMFGSRNTLIPMICGTAFILGQKQIKVMTRDKIKYVVIFLIVLVMMNVLKELRNIPLGAITVNAIIDAIVGGGLLNQIFEVINEMGYSMRVIFHTIAEIDGGLVNGEQTFLYTLIKGFVPVGVLNIFGIMQPENWSLATWVTNRYNFGGAGLGYSIIAEAYYNFREFGFLFFGLYGYLFVWLENIITKSFYRGHWLLASAWLYVIVYSIFLARADSCLITTPFRYAVYISVIHFIYQKMLPRSKNRYRSGGDT